MVGPSPDEQIRKHHWDFSRRKGRQFYRNRWIYPADPSQVPPFPFSPNPPSRYGREEEGWSQWRETAYQDEDNPTTHWVELGANIHLEGGYSEDIYGSRQSCLSLAVTNLDDGTRQVFGEHDYDGINSLRELPPVVQSNLVLTHLCGKEDEDWSLCFNYE